MNLDQILNTIAVPLEVGDLQFSLTPFTNARVAEWNRVMQPDVPDDAPQSELVKITEEVQAGQMQILAQHLRDCLAEGSAKTVTPKWVSTTFPQTILQQLAQYFASGERPEWAEARHSGN